MVSGLLADALVVVALVGFYGGLARDFATATGFVDGRVGLALSLGSYVAGGVAALLALATVAAEVAREGSAPVGAAATAVGLSLLFAVVFGLFFRFGVAVYALLLRVGLNLPRG
jgi:succinate-acetate transporter protein